MNFELISVVVPVYNVEAYLDDFMQSVLAQTYTNLEIILVDDGSKDTSGKKCDWWMKQDARIKVIHQKNKGVSEARNTGLKYVTGEYISFVDPDDLLHPKMYEFLWKALKETDSEISLCREESFTEKYEFEKMDQVRIQEVNDKKAFLKHFSDEWSVPNVVVWNKLYKKEVIGDNTFIPGTGSEDYFFNIDVMKNIHKVVRIENKLYGYRQRKGSLVRSQALDVSKDQIAALCYLKKNIEEENMPDVQREYEAYLLRRLARFRLQLQLQGQKNAQIYTKKVFYDEYKIIDKNILDKTQKINMFLARYLWPLYYMIHCKQVKKYI